MIFSFLQSLGLGRWNRSKAIYYFENCIYPNTPEVQKWRISGPILRICSIHLMFIFFLVWCLIKLWLSKDIEYFTWIFPHRNKWLQYMSYYYKRWFYEMHIDNGKSFPKTIIPILVFSIKIPWKISIHDFDALYFYFVDTLVGTFCDSSPVC